MKKIGLIILVICVQIQLFGQTSIKTDFGTFKVNKDIKFIEKETNQFLLKDSITLDSLIIFKKTMIKEVNYYDKLPNTITDFSIYDYPSESEDNPPNKESYFEGITSIYNTDLYYFIARKIYFRKGSYRNIEKISNDFRYYFLHKKKLYLISQMTDFYPNENVKLSQYDLQKIVNSETNNKALNELIKNMKLK